MTSYQELLTKKDLKKPVHLHFKIGMDGDKYFLLLGDDLQDGVSGFGKTLEGAVSEFKKNFNLQSI